MPSCARHGASQHAKPTSVGFGQRVQVDAFHEDTGIVNVALGDGDQRLQQEDSFRCQAEPPRILGGRFDSARGFGPVSEPQGAAGGGAIQQEPASVLEVSRDDLRV